MDKVREARTQLQAYRNASSDEQLRADCFRVDLDLEQFEVFLQQPLEHRETRALTTRYASSSNFPVIQDAQVPQLFVNNKPVLRLFLRDILYRVTRKKLYECLSAQGCTDFSIDSLKNTRKGSVAVISCKLLSSSCAIQIKSCKKELTFTDPRGRVSYIKTRPDQFTQQEPLPSTQPAFNKLTLLPTPLVDILQCGDVIKRLAHYLTYNNFLNLYTACHDDPQFHGTALPFDSCYDRYSHPSALNRMLEDVNNFKFTSISFNTSVNIIEIPFINKLLWRCVSHRPIPDKYLRLREMDLSAVTVSKKTFDLLSDSFAINKLTLGSTPGGCDEFLTITNLESLNFVNNKNLSLKFLTREKCSSLRSLSFNNCQEVPIERLFDFVKNNTHLTELNFSDSQGRKRHTVDLIMSIFSPSNVTEAFNFNYSACKVFRTEIIPRVVFLRTNALRTLNLENNDYFKGFVTDIIDNAPNLVELNLLGLDFNYPLLLSNLPQLRSIRINYNYHILNALISAGPKQTFEVLINNTWGKKRTRVINLANLAGVIHACEQIDFKFVNCRINVPTHVRQDLATHGVSLRALGNTVSLLKTL
ncbi:uncharacterized protein LOC116738643 [Nasonia vitripennis]|uniref:Uncharacterized protein n=1 Tax=Nasonia vitripennis TaxID=7425 RepID=A0A7M7R309_NASVI|nr:uncharacterized protein LOC116738643 [Nasonia vitripennis]